MVDVMPLNIAWGQCSLDMLPFRCKQMPFRCKQMPFRCKQVPFRCKQMPFRCKQVPFRCKQMLFRCKQVPFRCKQMPFNSQPKTAQVGSTADLDCSASSSSSPVCSLHALLPQPVPLLFLSLQLSIDLPTDASQVKGPRRSRGGRGSQSP